jgi:hypothetical protein
MGKRELYFMSLFILGISFGGCGSTALDERENLETIAQKQKEFIHLKDDRTIDLNAVNQFQEKLKRGE